MHMKYEAIKNKIKNMENSINYLFIKLGIMREREKEKEGISKLN